ncbi:glycerate kinase [Trujillonella humicola]|uniref:glycerate kinase n=1 Tax=Trujillonella humicola TaxID=3383699 RepID=UPI003905AF51
MGEETVVAASRPASGGLRVVVAPDKYRGSLTAAEAAQAMAAGVRDEVPDAAVDVLPVADGGEGTLDVLLHAGATPVPVRVPGPLGRPVDARIAVLGSTAYVESAQACGLALIASPGPATALDASTEGVGELLLAAARLDVRTAVVGLGGSATTDGGAGLARALGFVPLDAAGRQAAPGGGGLATVARLADRREQDALRGMRVVAACDVTAPLLGPQGAAAVFAPQKGAGPAEVRRLEQGLRAWAGVLAAATGRDVSALPGAGAAGGLAAALVALCGAEITSGATLLLDLVGLRRVVAAAHLVLTGEGAIDASTVAGKGPKAVADVARAAGVPVIAVAGRAERGDPAVARSFDVLEDLVTAFPGEDTLRDAGPLLRRCTRRAVGQWRSARPGPGAPD